MSRSVHLKNPLFRFCLCLRKSSSVRSTDRNRRSTVHSHSARPACARGRQSSPGLLRFPTAKVGTRRNPKYSHLCPGRQEPRGDRESNTFDWPCTRTTVCPSAQSRSSTTCSDLTPVPPG